MSLFDSDDDDAAGDTAVTHPAPVAPRRYTPRDRLARITTLTWLVHRVRDGLVSRAAVEDDPKLTAAETDAVLDCVDDGLDEPACIRRLALALDRPY